MVQSPEQPPPTKFGAVPIWSAAIAGLSLLFTLIGWFVWVGGTGRQVDVNSQRLTALEDRGSPGVQNLLSRVDALASRQNEIAHAVEGLPLRDSANEAQIAKIKAQLEEFSALRNETVHEWLDMAQRIAALEARTARIEAAIDQVRTDLEEHKRDDLKQLQDQVNRKKW